MYKLVSLAFIVLIAAGFIFAMEAIRGTIHGNGLVFVAICAGISALFLFIDPSARRVLSSGLLGWEALTFDTKFDDLKINGHVLGTIKTDRE
jgi:hypothetical protein